MAFPTPVTATGDLSDVASFDDDQLAVELADAHRRMAQSRHNPTGIAHTDAKMAVRVLEGETRRRNRVAA